MLPQRKGSGVPAPDRRRTRGILSEVFLRKKAGAEDKIALLQTPPESLEAKILFDADKLDVTGAVGMARTFFYAARVGQPLYTLLPGGTVSDGSAEEPEGVHSVLREYKVKLENIYGSFLTRRGGELARQRQAAARSIYENLLSEIREPYDAGGALLRRYIENLYS